MTRGTPGTRLALALILSPVLVTACGPAERARRGYPNLPVTPVVITRAYVRRGPSG
ncbi:MAG: hypothetical protein Q7J79_05340 [Gemmatimonadales bacterium]|nr:hypothetical protein [Gemmatimonadales bacterium]